MRTKTIDGQECILACGGPGFKVYISGDDWLIVKGKTKRYIGPHPIVGIDTCPQYSAIHKLIGAYVNLRFQPRDRQADIMAEFDVFLQTI